MGTPEDTGTAAKDRWVALIARFERIVMLVLMGLLMVIVSITTFQLGWMLFSDLGSIRELVLDTEEMFDLFGFFLIVLIGLELNTSLKSYIKMGVVRGDVVIEVALIAIAQKLIVLDTSRYGGLGLLGLAALVLSLAVAFWLLRRAYAEIPAAPDDVRQ